jgi:Galactose oxidase, central domain
VRLWTIAAAVIVVLILLLSDLPQVNTSTNPVPSPHGANPADATASTPASNAARSPFQGSAATGGPAVRASPAELCEEGIAPACPRSEFATPAASSVIPASGRPSSWTNLTPPKGKPNPTERYEAAMVYYPTANDVIVFGGFGTAPGGATTYLDDTWAYSGGHWTELIANASCTATTCPSPRAGAMLAYDAQSQSLLLFGGYITVPVGIFGAYRVIAFNDTWSFANDTWTNLTTSAGAAPPARELGAMTYDPSDNYVLLFGGENATQDSTGDTWKFQNNAWTQLNLATNPGSREEMSMAYSPDGYVLLFGGQTVTASGATKQIIQNNCNGASGPYIGWWFYKGAWTPMNGTWFDAGYGECAPMVPRAPAINVSPDTITGAPFPPCGRIGAAVGWSPKNNRFVIYGGYGPTDYGFDACFGTDGVLNDTYTYALYPGGFYLWNNATSPPGPPARELMGSASDFGDGYFEIFGGYNDTTGSVLNETWRFYELVYAKLTGPNSIDTAPGSFNLLGDTWTLDGYGGTGDLDYKITYAKIRNSNALAGTAGCSNITSGATDVLPYNGTWDFNCFPTAKSFNVDRVTLSVIDEGNSSHPKATANWTFTILPPQAIAVYSEYVQDFYQNVNFEDTFTIWTEVAGGGAISVAASIGGQKIGGLNRTDGGKFWNVTLNMSPYGAGTTLQAEAQFGNWTLNVTDALTIVDTPSWLLTLFKATGATQSVIYQGSGVWNKTYTIDEKYAWSLSSSTNFSIPVTLVGGSYGLIPSVNVLFTATSGGALGITGTFSLSTPSISIGPASLKVTASLSMTGTFDVVGSGVQWGSASAAITVTATLSASIPIYGFSLFGCNIGFTLQLSISPSITLDLILAPATSPSQDLIPDVGVMIQRFVGSFSLALSASINFGIGIASIGLGVGLSVAVAFTITPSFDIAAGWVNGSIFVTAQFLWWSDSFNIVGPANIFSWGPDAGVVHPGLGPYLENSYNNGTDTKWVVQEEYYAASDYDQNLWNTASTAGPAISDIYPWTEVASAAGYNGADLFFTDDNTSAPQSTGLLISAAHLDGSTNAFAKVVGPVDADDYEIANPKAVTLPNGEEYVLWTALPNSEASVPTPLELTSMELQGAEFYPNNLTWGPVHTFSVGGFAQSYQVNVDGNSGAVLELIADRPLLTNTAAENLVEYNLTTGAVISNETTSGYSEIISFRGTPGLAVLLNLWGNYTVVQTSTLGPVAILDSPPHDGSIVSETFAEGSSSTLLVLYRGNLSSELVVYDTGSQSVVGTLNLGVDALDAQGITVGPNTDVFVRSIAGLQGWAETAGSFTNLTNVSLPGIVSYGIVQSGSGFVLYSIVDTGGNATEPIRDLELAEFGAALAPVTAPPGVSTTTSPPGSSSTSTPDYLLYLVIAAVAVVLILAVIAVATRRKSPPSGGAGASAEAVPAPPPGASGAPTSGTTDPGTTPPPPS